VGLFGTEVLRVERLSGKDGGQRALNSISGWGLGAGEQHAVVERVQEPVLVSPVGERGWSPTI
jgi:hypothetical protein